MTTQILANVEEEWVMKRKGVLLDVEGEGVHQICSLMWADNSGSCPLKRAPGANVKRSH